MSMTTYGDISPRTAAHAVAKMLKRAIPNLVLELFGQTYVLPKNSSKVAKFRRYEALPLATTPLVEGVTPAGSSLTHTDVEATLYQYGDFVTITDVVQDTHEDPVLMQAMSILGEQAAQTIETIRFNVLKAGTNVYYANKVAGRSTVDTAIALADQRRVTRGFKRQNARPITEIVASTPDFNTESTEAGFVALIHPDLENDVRALTGFISIKDYGVKKAFPGEIGAVDNVRYVISTIFDSFKASGAAGASTTTFVSEGGVTVDVYPVLYIAADSYGIVPLKGEASLTPMVVNPKPSDSDPLAQRGKASWKTMQTAVILNELWMARLEVLATEV